MYKIHKLLVFIACNVCMIYLLCNCLQCDILVIVERQELDEYRGKGGKTLTNALFNTFIKMILSIIHTADDIEDAERKIKALID